MFTRIRHLLQSIVLIVLSYFIKRRENCIAVGSWGGERFADNSMYLALYLADTKQYDVFWVCNESVIDEFSDKYKQISFLKINTFRTNLVLLKCKYFFFSQMHFADISSNNVYRGAITCYLHHGMPIKKWGDDGLNQGRKSKSIMQAITSSINGENIAYNYFAVSSDLHAVSNLSSLNSRGCRKDKNICSGTPRNDLYFCYSQDYADELKQKYSKLIGFDKQSKIVLYLPTYRRVSKNVFSFSGINHDDYKRLNDILERKNCVLIEKSHIAEKTVHSMENHGRILFAESGLNVQEMMYFTDLLVSDYSGAYLDFILLDRPVIHFAYDYDYYKNVDSGLYYDIDDFAAGKVAVTLNEVLDEMASLLNGIDLFENKRKYVREKYMTYERGNASEIITSTILGGNTNGNICK